MMRLWAVIRLLLTLVMILIEKIGELHSLALFL